MPGPRGRPSSAPIPTGRVPYEQQRIAERIAARVRQVYGLKNTLAAPLATDGVVIGAIVLSHRMPGSWSATTRRLLNGAARSKVFNGNEDCRIGCDS